MYKENPYNQAYENYMFLNKELKLLLQEAKSTMKPFISKLQNNSKIIDIGCGRCISALVCLKNKNLNIVCIDNSEKMLSNPFINKEHPTVEIIYDDFFAREFTTHSFDGAIMRAFIHLFPLDILKNILFPKVKKLIKRDGLIHLSTSLHSEYKEGFEYKQGGKGYRYRIRFTQEILEDLLKEYFIISDLVKSEEITDRNNPKTWVSYTLVNKP